MLSDLAAAVRSGAIDPADLVAESVRRIEATRHLNAVIDMWPDDALAEARNHRRTGALAGLPVLVKDMARVAGRRTTAGSLLLADAPPDAVDDVVVARLREAGAIVLGRTNSPEFGATAYTSNLLHGTTRNPWNPERSPGGSSGGSTAALAAGLAPLATTSDGGGSVRGPASMSGLFGYKPSMGAIGRNVLPRWIGFSTQGATGTSVADVALEASVTLGPARGDYLALPSAGVDLAATMPARVLACRTFRSGVDPDIESAFEATLEALVASGVTVERIDSPVDSTVMWAWFTVSTAELAQSLRDRMDRRDEMTDYVRMQIDWAGRVTLDDYIAAQRLRHEVSARFDDLLGDDSVLVVPVMNARSWPAEGPLPVEAGGTRDPMGTMNTADLNFTGHPAFSVPMGLDDHGVPCGLQVVAPRFRDGLGFGLAAHLERIRPWPLVAPGHTPFGPG